ncbi:ATP-binding protein [Neorhizobium galegae]|uniref:ATP-binding protein n=1 Tax=Neorhizobium galegae TaxID=399 RepID=UPI0006217C4E|nr:ATP-binding protein [Neorhizobium galegae]CDZ28041.1 ATP-dependent protease subunit [Neorhizobium galegae bv. officinalis]KAA9386950.1 ATP-binding protein [Neorhizobium galegae]KAB1116063.1 ATP-binding protein [Neorhizobium galegae]MCM2499931.1 ATP-binding protein [Neorhizobium galegae]MCQ1773832.1 ATP-binding protein [Neorhizobium galegae]
MSDDINTLILTEIRRLADALERLAGPPPAINDWNAADCFVWVPANQRLQPVPRPNRVALTLIRGVDHVRDILHENTLRFAEGFAANNVLLWGARGMGKSSLVKAVHEDVRAATGTSLKLVEVHREDIASLPALLDILKASGQRVIVFCDDLSFDHDDTAYKSLKAALDGGIEGRPDNVLFYATSNRRHLLPRHMMENEQSTAINPSEAVEEKVSLSDRFGLWLGFHKCSQDDYLKMIDGYAEHFELGLDQQTLHHEALEWATTRGGRSGRVAWQYIQDLAGRLRKPLSRD